MDVDIKVFAYSFPAISLVLGFLLLLSGSASDNPELITWGGILIAIGFVGYIIPIVVTVLSE